MNNSAERPIEEVLKDFSALMGELMEHSECPSMVGQYLNELYVNTMNENAHTGTVYRLTFPGIVLAVREYERDLERVKVERQQKESG